MACINKNTEKISKEIIEEFKNIGVGDIGHILDAPSFMDIGIRPVYRDIKLVGPAFTARMLPGDVSLSRKIIELAEPGDVIVIDRCGDLRYACWGGAVTLFSKVKGIAGLIVDGSVTDGMEIADMKWPVFSRGISGLVGRRLDKGGEINVPINCGGVVVNPRDLIVADDDGIAVIKPREAEELLKKLRERFGSVPPIRKWIAEGKPLELHPNANLLQKK